jgi:hypothetical protein
LFNYFATKAQRHGFCVNINKIKGSKSIFS